MQAASLQSILNDVSKRLDAFQEEEAPVTQDLMSELDVFARLDPLLGDLQKQYRNAQLTRRQQEKQFGHDSAMADVALEAQDSAWCAMQTRYMEVRKDRSLMHKVQSILHRQKQEQLQQQEEKLQTERTHKAEQLRLYHQLRQNTDIRRDQKGGGDILLAWLWLFIFHEKMRFAHSFERFAAPLRAA